MKPSWSRSKLWPEAPKPGALGAAFHLLGLGVPVAPSSSSGKAFLFAHLSTLRQLDPSQPAPPGSETSSFPAGSREYSCVYMTLGRGRVTDDLNSGGLLVSGFVLNIGSCYMALAALNSRISRELGWKMSVPHHAQLGAAPTPHVQVPSHCRASCGAETASGGSSLGQGRGLPLREQTHSSQG